MDEEVLPPDETAEEASTEAHHLALHRRLLDLESKLTSPVVKGVGKCLDSTFVPAWRRLTEGEARWPVAIAVAAALAMQFFLPDRLVLGPRWLFPSLGGALLIAIMATNPG